MNTTIERLEKAKTLLQGIEQIYADVLGRSNASAYIEDAIEEIERDIAHEEEVLMEDVPYKPEYSTVWNHAQLGIKS